MLEVYIENLEGIWFSLAISKQRIVTTSFDREEKTALNKVLSNLPFNSPFQVFHEPSALAKDTLSTLKDIYDGKETDSHLALATTHLPSYTKKVLKATLSIPVGYVTSYGAIAKAVGGGPRAVGNAMACNLFPPIVPCHRVVKSDLGLGGYGIGGLAVKLAFLQREMRGYNRPKDLNVGGCYLTVYPVERVLLKYA